MRMVDVAWRGRRTRCCGSLSRATRIGFPRSERSCMSQLQISEKWKFGDWVFDAHTMACYTISGCIAPVTGVVTCCHWPQGVHAFRGLLSAEELGDGISSDKHTAYAIDLDALILLPKEPPYATE